MFCSVIEIQFVFRFTLEMPTVLSLPVLFFYVAPYLVQSLQFLTAAIIRSLNLPHLLDSSNRIAGPGPNPSSGQVHKFYRAITVVIAAAIGFHMGHPIDSFL